jgi:hypothetical protein
VRIELSKEYPLRPPLFRIKKAKKKPVAAAATTTTAAAPQLPNYPQHIRNKMDANALQQLSTSVKESSYDPTLKQIESELNTNSSALVGSESDRINILPLLMNRLRVRINSSLVSQLTNLVSRFSSAWMSRMNSTKRATQLLRRCLDALITAKTDTNLLVKGSSIPSCNTAVIRAQNCSEIQRLFCGRPQLTINFEDSILVMN